MRISETCFRAEIDEMLGDVGLMQKTNIYGTGAFVKSEESINIFTGATGIGYALSTPDELGKNKITIHPIHHHCMYFCNLTINLPVVLTELFCLVLAIDIHYGFGLNYAIKKELQFNHN